MSLATNVSDLATRIGTEIKAVYNKIGTLGSLTTTEKTNLVGAINEVKASIGGAGATINDVTPSGTTVYSSNKTDSQISTAVSGLVASAPGALNTLDELAQALGDDAAFSTTVTTALGNRLRFDAAQTLSAGEKTQGQTNLGVVSSTDIGSTTTNFVTTFEAALV